VNRSGVNLSGKVIVITGSTRGIGLAIAGACAKEGASIVVSSRSADAVRDTVAEFETRGFSVSGIAADVSNYKDIVALYDHAIERWGRIDVWVNNAGISEGYRPLDELSPDEINSIVSINLTGHMLCARQILPYFMENGGILINMTGRGYRGEATPYTAAYASTKAAIASLTKSLAQEMTAYPVSVHAIVPGMVATDFYVDIKTSPRLASTADNWRYALDAFGVPLDEVGALGARIAAETPGEKTGSIYSMLGGMRLARGIAKITWYKLTGKLGREGAS
jgi:glucose 1-dehydrogenase